MRILDKYILKKYLSTFLLIMVLLLPIAIAIDISEKVDKFMAANLSAGQVLKEYYLNFVVIYGNTFMPLALFIAVIFFTSKLASNTEIIAIHSGKISFTRFLRPYFIGATIVTVLALAMNHFVVPKSNKIYEAFMRDYVKKKLYNANLLNDINLQLSEDEYIFLDRFNISNNRGSHFSLQKYNGIELEYELTAEDFRWVPSDTTYVLNRYGLRYFLEGRDSISNGTKLDTLFNFRPKDLQTADYLAKEMNSVDLSEFIDVSRQRGMNNLNSYLVEFHKRTSLPISSYILTFIAVCLAARKKRGGMGVNLAIGISLMFVYVFFLKIGEVLGAGAETNPLFMVWLPNICFGALALYLYFKNAKN